jgi:hypothetical protein
MPASSGGQRAGRVEALRNLDPVEETTGRSHDQASQLIDDVLGLREPSTRALVPSPRSRMSTLAKIGFVELAFAGLLGWALVARLQNPDALQRFGVKSPRRVLQCHLDQIMMSLILIATSLALPGLANAIQVPLAFGAIMNPLLFFVQAFSDKIGDALVFKTISLVSVIAMSGSLVAVAVTALGR